MPVLNKNWVKGDKVEVELPMAVKRVEANENLKERQRKSCASKGPIMYCAEWVDNGGKVTNFYPSGRY
jgi:DUF1680 family protein